MSGADRSPSEAEETPAETETEAPRWMIHVGWAGRLITAGVFLAAAVGKLLDPAAFATNIGNYQAFPHWTWNLAAAVVPVTEVIGALAVLSGYKRRAGAIVLGSLTIAFIGLIASVMIRGIDLNCGCFGESSADSSVGWVELIRDLGLLVAIVAAYLPPERSSR